MTKNAQLLEHSLFKKAIPPPLNFFSFIFVKNQWSIFLWVYFDVLSSVALVYVSIYPLQYHTILITVAIEYMLLLVRVIPHTLFFFFNIYLAILGLVFICTNFRINLSMGTKCLLASVKLTDQFG